MAQRFALPVLAALALTALLGSLTLPTAAENAKPGTIVTVAGTGAPSYSGDGGPAAQAQLNWPSGLAFDAAGNLFIADLPMIVSGRSARREPTPRSLGPGNAAFPAMAARPRTPS
jgi:hypothetical protein